MPAASAAMPDLAELGYVPDGDPCPVHGLPTCLLQLPYAGLVSQCQGCRDAYLDWHAAQLRVVAPVVVLHPRPVPVPNRTSVLELFG